jgi:hypothetical protein
MQKDIPKFCKRAINDVYFFGWIRCLKTTLPTISNEKACLNFINKHGLEDVSLNTLISTYSRMNKEYFDIDKN